MMTVLAGLAEFERELIRARTSAGRDSAKAKGVRFGRKPKPRLDLLATYVGEYHYRTVASADFGVLDIERKVSPIRSADTPFRNRFLLTDHRRQ
jgi:Resolvase, N terminal domain